MKLLFTEMDIHIQTKILAKKINDTHREDPTPIIMVGLLNGCFMFYSDLMKNISVDIKCDFMRVKSYVGKRKQGDVQVLKDLETPVKGKHVYLIDDIYDTGNTMKAVIEYLKMKQPESINIVTLLKRKTTTSPKNIPHSYGFEINDEWVVGAGCDDENGYKRNLPSIWSV